VLPRLLLRIVDLTQIQYVSLGDAAFGQSTILDDAPVAMDLAVFAPFGAFQKHARSVKTLAARANDQGLHYTRFFNLGIVKGELLQHVAPCQNQRMVSIGERIAKDGLAGGCLEFLTK
jgi:hypothetical protein